MSVITTAELELGVLRASAPDIRAMRLRMLGRVRSEFPLFAIDDQVGSCFARLADEQLRAGRKPRRHDTWIAATALRHGAAVVTKDDDFSTFASVDVIHV